MTKHGSRPHDAHRPVTGKSWMQVCALPLTDVIPSTPSHAHYRCTQTHTASCQQLQFFPFSDYQFDKDHDGPTMCLALW